MSNRETFDQALYGAAGDADELRQLEYVFEMAKHRSVEEQFEGSDGNRLSQRVDYRKAQLEGIRAVRAAIGPGVRVPEIPVGWRLAGIVEYHDSRRFGDGVAGYKASIRTEDPFAPLGWLDGYGVDHNDALREAIRAAEEAEGDVAEGKDVPERPTGY